ncbi:uncharacterized protein C8A04DRAFT_39834 [Dichotomopilus funicola]|uniref:CCHC-type domain-containing protein n=1 Tax=Dichotomopilus funicola TaxID=1934379 RepID=A0AAN6UXX2_9PEZI|nr:hypothetical protein C8A04DRAFT_39834 [Dichotomopilus funicola]
MPPPTSGPPAMAKQATPKTMSSRLMTMKFMQRGAAAAAAAAATSNTPTTSNSPVNTPSNDGPTKRRKVSHTPSTSGAGSPATTPLFDQQAIKAALEQEEKRNRAAIERRAAELGDSHWVLEGAASAPPRIARPLLNVVPVGFAQIDGSTAATASGQDVYDDDPFDMGGVSARPQFQRFNMKKSKARHDATKGDDDEGKSDSESGSGSESGEASDNDRSPRASSRADTGRGRQSTVDRSDRKRARSSVSGRREEERRKAHQLAGKRRKKEIKLNQLSSISSAGSQGFQRPSAVLSCHGCGKPGHKVADCPNRKR